MRNALIDVREILTPAIKDAIEVAIDYHRAFDIEDLDNANDMKSEFNPDEGMVLNAISTVIWQAMVVALKQEDLGEDSETFDTANAFQAIFQQIGISHFG